MQSILFGIPGKFCGLHFYSAWRQDNKIFLKHFDETLPVGIIDFGTLCPLEGINEGID